MPDRSEMPRTTTYEKVTIELVSWDHDTSTGLWLATGNVEDRQMAMLLTGDGYALDNLEEGFPGGTLLLPPGSELALAAALVHLSGASTEAVTPGALRTDRETHRGTA